MAAPSSTLLTLATALPPAVVWQSTSRQLNPQKTNASMLTSRDLVDNCSSGVLGHVVDDDLGAEASVH